MDRPGEDPSKETMDEKRFLLTEEQIRELSEPPDGAAIFAIGCMAVALVAGFCLGFVVKMLIG